MVRSPIARRTRRTSPESRSSTSPRSTRRCSGPPRCRRLPLRTRGPRVRARSRRRQLIADASHGPGCGSVPPTAGLRSRLIAGGSPGQEQPQGKRDEDKASVLHRLRLRPRNPRNDKRQYLCGRLQKDEDDKKPHGLSMRIAMRPTKPCAAALGQRSRVRRVRWCRSDARETAAAGR